MNHDITEYFAIAALWGAHNCYSPFLGKGRHYHVTRHHTKKGPGRIPSRQRDFYWENGVKVYKYRKVKGVPVVRVFGSKRRCKRCRNIQIGHVDS